MRIKLTESQLKSMVKEAIRETLNEIGDTEQGLKTLIGLRDKAANQMRYGQADKIGDYTNQALKSKFNFSGLQEATEQNLIYVNDQRNIVTIVNDGDVKLETHPIGNLSYEYDLFDIKANCQLANPMAARKIAAWCQMFAPKVLDKAKDWHFWAKQ